MLFLSSDIQVLLAQRGSGAESWADRAWGAECDEAASCWIAGTNIGLSWLGAVGACDEKQE